MHLDMNSYFASVEQQDNPVWRGLPLGVCEHLGGIIIAASIEAKKWGIKTGTPVWEAKKLYPKIILTPTRPDAYRLYNRRMVKVVSDYTNYVERYSIDEVFADISKVCNVRGLRAKGLGLSEYYQINPFEEAVRVAQEIKRRMKKEVGDYLTCSIGLAENKLLAKIGSDLRKPDGIVVIWPSSFVIPKPEVASEDEEFLKDNNSSSLRDPRPTLLRRSRCGRASARPDTSGLGRDDTTDEAPLLLSKADLYQCLKLIDIPGIGRRQEQNLNALGIKTLLDLKNHPKSHLVSRFGPLMGHHLHQMGQLEGSWKAKVEEDRGIKSIGHMYTLPKEYRKPEFFIPVLYKLCEMVGQRLRKQKLTGNIIHFFVSTPESNFSKSISSTSGLAGQISENFSFSIGKIANGVNKNYEGFSQDRKLGFYIYDGHDIFLQIADLHADLLRGSARGSFEFKLIGVTVAGLKPYVRQLSLFGDEERTASVASALDRINAKYGGFTICRAPVLKAKYAFKDSIGFGRLKEFTQRHFRTESEYKQIKAKPFSTEFK